MSRLIVYCDYVCPYVYRASEWVLRLQSLLDAPPEVEWRFFSLSQVNRRTRDGWAIWNQPAQQPDWETEDYARGLRFFWAAEAAARQGDEAFVSFHLALLRAIHVDHDDVDDRRTIVEVARTVGLGMDRFQADFQDQSCLDRLRADHESGAQRNVFGTPTFIFPDAEPAYLKLTRALNDQECLECWDSTTTIMARRPYVLEIKRPQ